MDDMPGSVVAARVEWLDALVFVWATIMLLIKGAHLQQQPQVRLVAQGHVVARRNGLVM